MLTLKTFYRCINAKRLYSTTRIDSLLVSRSVGSRKRIKDLIRQRRVFDDNGNIILSSSKKVSVHAIVHVDGAAVNHIPLLAICHKPVGVLSTLGDPLGRPSLLELLTPPTLNHQDQNQDKDPCVLTTLRGMHPVGRLDSDTSGLLLFSSDGRLTNKLLQPQSGIERVYEAVVAGLVNFEELKSVLAEGVRTTDGAFPAVLMECTHIKYEVSMAAAFKTTKDFDLTLGKMLDQADLTKPTLSKIRLSVKEGKYRMVRRILHNAGHSVVQLKRVSYGEVNIGDLHEGQFRVAGTEVQQWAGKLLSNTGNTSSNKQRRTKRSTSERRMDPDQ